MENNEKKKGERRYYTIPKSATNIHIHHFKTTFMCPRSNTEVPCDSCQALPGYLITAHHSCVFLRSWEG